MFFHSLFFSGYTYIPVSCAHDTIQLNNICGVDVCIWYGKIFELFLVIIMIITSEKENGFSLKMARVLVLRNTHIMYIVQYFYCKGKYYFIFRWWSYWWWQLTKAFNGHLHSSNNINFASFLRRSRTAIEVNGLCIRIKYCITYCITPHSSCNVL